MLTVSELRDRIGRDFPDVKQVSDTAVRFFRVMDKTAYAVCYVDVAKQLPATMEALTSYQDRVIGQYYFEGPRSLQWSNYLYFLQPEDVLDDPATVDAKHLIETDRTYARKFVLPEEQLDEVLKPPLIEAPQIDNRINVMAAWSAKLTQPGLGDAVFKDLSMPSRIRLIEKVHEGQPPRTPQAPAVVGPSKPPPFIKEFKIRKFRPYPTLPEFSFGKVNLIFGPNAVGKTSLLEAIELFYCGRNNRDPAANEDYSFRAVLADGKSESATSGRAQKLFRDRNLAWYGQHELRTNTLYRSFSLFNFLDTDAAVSITDSTKDLEDNLSRLLVGPEASNVWRNIERLSDALEGHVRDVSTRVDENREARDRIAAQLEAEANLPQESDAIKNRLDAMMRKLKWKYPVAGDPEEQAASLASALAEYAALADHAANVSWAASPASLASLKSYCTSTLAAIEAAAPLVAKWSELESGRTKCEAELKTPASAIEQARAAHLLIESNVPRRHIEAGRLREDDARLAAQLAGIEALQRATLQVVSDLTLKAALRYSASERDAAQKALAEARKRLTDFTTLRDKSIQLGQQLRAIADQILENASNPDECPLCHATYEAGELASHFHAGVDIDLEATAQALHQQVRTAQVGLDSAGLLQEQVELLVAFTARAGGTRDTTVKDALKLLDERRSEQGKIASALARVEAELRDLASRDLSHRRFEAAIAQLERLGHPLREHTLRSVTALIDRLTSAVKTAQERIQNLSTNIAALQDELTKHLGAAAATVADAKTLIGRDRERLARTQSLLSKLAVFAQNFPWPPRNPLAELLVSARSVRSVAAELQTSLEREKQERHAHSKALEDKQELDERLLELEPLLQRLSSARDTLKEIKERDSLTDAVSAALQNNRTAIEAIFARIHTPPEFEGLGDTFDKLRRKNGQDAPLAQISTGQRAAFALSIFLARNNQANAAPPVMLIDDPIAHIDDFNALSFLDYLRTLVIDRNRQIFFATANDKIAALFERKFDFLKEDFQRINLTRERASHESAR